MDASLEGPAEVGAQTSSLNKLATFALGLPVTVVLISAWLTAEQAISETTDGFIRVTAYLLISAFLLYASAQADAKPRLRKCIWLLVFAGLVPRVLGWTEDIASLESMPVLGDRGWGHDGLVTIFGIFWVLLPFVLIYRMVASLREMHVELKSRVQERTFELQESNQRLSQEICDRLQAENELDQARRNLETVAASRSHQLREAQSQLVRQERLSALGKMASGIAHELNNTLSPVVAYSDLMKTSDNLTKKQREWLEYISQGASDAADVIRGLKKFHGGHTEEERELIDVVRLVEQVVEMTRPVWRDAAKAEGKRIKLYLEIDSEPKTDANPVELRQVLINLILNSTEAIVDSGTISIRIESSDNVRIEVRDNGVGMTPHEMERCFEPFYTSKKLGTGLGLSVCHGLVRDHGGSLSVESTPGVGTQFVVELPLAKEAKPNQQSVNISSYRDTKSFRLTCLYVDDNEMLRTSFASICRANNVSVTLADSAEEALRIIDGARFDLVITDLSMGEMDGVDMIQEIRQRGIETPIVLLTGWLESKVNMRLKGMIQPNCVLEKPASAFDYLTVFNRFAPNKMTAIAS